MAAIILGRTIPGMPQREGKFKHPLSNLLWILAFMRSIHVLCLLSAAVHIRQNSHLVIHETDGRY